MFHALRIFVALALLAIPSLAQGPVLLMGIDAEDNNPPQHGGIGPYVDVIGNGLLPNIGNGGTGLLVIGGGKSGGDDVTVFWNLVAAGLGESVTYVNGAQISTQSFAGFSVVAIASAVAQTPSGGLTNQESNALNARAADLATHVNGGGGLFGTSQRGLPTPYGYLGTLGSFTFSFPSGFNQVTPTAEGLAIGITATNLDVNAWHDEYVTFPGFLDVLATNDNTGRACAIGGAQVIIVQGIALTPLTALNPIGTTHTVTATVADNQGNPVVGTVVTFNVIAGPHVGTSFMAATDVNGQAFFTYLGTLTGVDTIQGCFTDNNAVVRCAEVTKEWFCTPCALTCPPDVSLDCSASTDPASTGTPAGCGTPVFSDSTMAGACPGSFVITRTWSAPDGCGGTASCIQTITVTDSSAPVISCPADVALDCADPSDPAATGTATAVDDCSGVASLVSSDSIAMGNCPGNFVITRTWTATDGCGNSSSCDQTITVSDTTAPILICPPDVTVIGCCVLPGIGMATATDACGSASVTNDAPDQFCLGDTLVTWTAIDECGNVATCQQLVSVVPVILDFETDGAGMPLAHGQSLETVGPETAYSCPSLSSGPDTIQAGDGNNGAAIFDSTNGPFGQDPDLGVGQGNILYLQSNGGPTDNFMGIHGPDTWDFPNDDEDGGMLIFDFCAPVTPLSVDLIDIDALDPNQHSGVVLTDGNGLTRSYSILPGWTGSGPGPAGVGTLRLDELAPQPGFAAAATQVTQAGFDGTNVIQIRVRLGSSGAIDNLTYCPSGPSATVTSRNGAGVNPEILTPVSMPVVGTQWTAELDCSAYGEGLAILEVCGASQAGSPTPFGEVLVSGALLLRVVQPYSGAASQLVWNLPYDLSLCGLAVHVQGTCQENTVRPLGGKTGFVRMHLSNALDLNLGF